MRLSPRARRILLFSATTAAIILLWGTPLLYPLHVFVVLLHEASHGLAAVATGGSVDHIGLDPNQGGYTLTRGGNPFVILSAGYLGSLAWGAAILRAARSRRAGVLAMLLGVGVLGLTLLYVRSFFGLLFGLLFGGAAVLGGRRLPHSAIAWLLLVLGLTSCIYAVLDIKSDILDRPGLPSDAQMLAELTGIPTLVWGLAWFAIAVAVSWVLFRRALARR